ncbi:MAG TPA: zinc ribbon domain-containing protein [Thermoplasmata archaeon]|nr:zinc ribbon domain-containing protein [Thermoplasmata archaeon]
MPPTVVRGYVYRPAWTLDGRPAAGPDEDAFTLAATALEGLLASAPADPLPGVLRLVGAFPEVSEWGFAPLLGRPVRVVHDGEGPSGLAAALRPSEDALVVAVDLPERGEDSRSAEGALAVAARLAAEGPSGPDETARPGTGTGAEAALALAASAVGGWIDHPRRPGRLTLDAHRLRAAVEAPTRVVAEGALVPRARYLESLPSRWRLVAERCPRCAATTFPARGACARCGERSGLVPFALPYDGGTVVAATAIGPGGQPTEFDAQVAAQGPYGVVLVALAPAVHATFAVTDAAPVRLALGTRVGTRLRRLYPMEGEWRYGRKAVPLPSGDQPGPSAAGGSHGAPTQPE